MLSTINLNEDGEVMKEETSNVGEGQPGSEVRKWLREIPYENQLSSLSKLVGYSQKHGKNKELPINGA